MKETETIMRYEEIVEHIKKQSVGNAETCIGILLECPLSRHQQEAHGVLLNKWGGYLGREWYLTKASLVLLMKKPRTKVSNFSTVEVSWKAWWRSRFAKKSFAGQKFVLCREKIEVCEVSKDGQYVGGKIFGLYVLDLSEYEFSLRHLMGNLKSLEKRLKKDNVHVKKFEISSYLPLSKMA